MDRKWTDLQGVEILQKYIFCKREIRGARDHTVGDLASSDENRDGPPIDVAFNTAGEMTNTMEGSCQDRHGH